MIEFILYTLFVSILSSFFTIKLRNRAIKKEINKIEKEYKEKAISVTDWFKNDLKSTVEDEHYAEVMLASINHLYITLFQSNGLLALAKYISIEDKMEIVQKLTLLHRNYLQYREKSLLRLYGLLKLNENKLKEDTKLAISRFTLVEKQKTLLITEQFENIIQALISTMNGKENNDRF